MNLLTKKDLLALNQEIGETGELSNESSLDFTFDRIKTKKNWLYGLSYLVRSLLVDHVFKDGNKRTCLLVVTYYLEYYHKRYYRDKLLFTIEKIAKKNITHPLTITRLIDHVIIEENK